MLRRRSCWCCHLPATEREQETSLFNNPLIMLSSKTLDRDYASVRERAKGDSLPESKNSDRVRAKVGLDAP